MPLAAAFFDDFSLTKIIKTETPGSIGRPGVAI
jgi:hypothetical protein